MARTWFWLPDSEGHGTERTGMRTCEEQVRSVHMASLHKRENSRVEGSHCHPVKIGPLEH